MPIWSSSTITRFTEEGEREIAKRLRCLIARSAISIVAATATYDLPSDCLDIRRITWLGRKIYPINFLDFQYADDWTIRTAARPDGYIFNQQGRNTIRFYPTPNVTIASTSSNLFGSEIVNRVIVEYWQLPDHVTYKIPAYVRRRLIKYYVLMKCFSIEGKGQNLKVARKMQTRFDFYMEHFNKINQTHFITKIPALSLARHFDPLAPPVLSNKFGIGVDR